MKYLIYFLLFLLSIGCTEQFETEIIETYPDGEPKETWVYYDKNDHENYIIKSYHQNGNLSFEGKVSNNKFIEYKKSFFSNGNPKEFLKLLDSADLDFCCPDGYYKNYYENGNLRETHTRLNGMDNGLITTYDTTGIKVAECELIEDKKNGLLRAFYSNGRIHYIQEFKNDTIIGTGYYFTEKGDSLKRFATFKGQMDYPIKYWRESGNSLLGEYYNGNYFQVKWTWRDPLGKITKVEIVDTVNGQFITPDY